MEIWTNHKNLDYFRVAQKLNHRQARWSLYLSRFDFTLHHKPGQSMGKPDALSRRADHGSGQGDNNNLTLLAPELFRIHALAGMRLEGDECNILREVWRSLKDDVQEESVAKAARELWKDKSRGTIKSAEWSKSDGLLMFHGKIYIPRDRTEASYCRAAPRYVHRRICRPLQDPQARIPQLLVAPDVPLHQYLREAL
jgi:hypothetical protein